LLKIFYPKNTKFGTGNTPFWPFRAEFMGKNKILDTHNLLHQNGALGKWQFLAQPNFLAHDAAVCNNHIKY